MENKNEIISLLKEILKILKKQYDNQTELIYTTDKIEDLSNDICRICGDGIVETLEKTNKKIDEIRDLIERKIENE